MKAMVHRLIDAFFNSQLDFRVKLFNLLAMAGALISALMVISSLVAAKSVPLALLNLGIGGLSAGLLYYSYASGRYQRCYLVTILFIFFLGFGFLFFSGGGYRSGLPSFFVFGIVFTAFMLKGRLMAAIIALEMIFYTTLCVYAYYVPEHVVWFQNEAELLQDTIIGFVSVGLVLGVTMYFIFRLYDRQQRQLEQAREEAILANQAKSIFLANMSHEVRTPINIMLGMNEMVLREQPSEAVSGYISRAQDAGQMLLSLINDILDVSKIECGKMELLEEAYDTGELIQRLTQMGLEQAGKKGLAFSAETRGLPAMLWGDPLHIRQIAANFLSNAVKYTESGWVKLTVTGTSGDEGKLLLSISVSDSGIGIRQEQIEGLFEAFARGEAARNRQIEGTGLGLAIAKELVTLMGGQLRVRSEYRKGSTFTAEIPQRLPEKQEGGPLKKFNVLKGESFVAPQGRILLVDDNEGNLEVVKALLARTLLQIDTAQSGRQCLALAEANPYHAILLDYMMPEMDGIETLRGLRRLGCSAPALTADITAETRQKLLSAGFLQYLSKPASWVKLEQALLGCLPQELVTHTKVGVPREMAGEARELASHLKNYDISLERGLHFLSGDLEQYKTIAGLFWDHTGDMGSRLNSLAREGELSVLTHAAHSLKTLAAGIGAGALSSSCRELEVKCRVEDREYIRVAMPLLLYQLAYVRRGLESLHRGSSEGQESCRQDGETCALLSERARFHIANYHGAESCRALLRLLEREHGPKGRKLLGDACAAAEALCFEEAEALLEQYCSLEKEGSAV